MTASAVEPGRTADPVTHARILRIAGPIVLSNATVPLLGAVDVAVILGLRGERTFEPRAQLAAIADGRARDHRRVALSTAC